MAPARSSHAPSVRRTWMLLWATAVTLLLVARAEAQTTEDPLGGAQKTKQAAARIHKSEGYDDALVFEDEPKLSASSGRMHVPNPSPPAVPLPSIGLSALAPLLYGLLAILVIVVLVLVIRAITSTKRNTLSDAAEADAVAAEAVPPIAEQWLAQAALDDAEVLAGQGRFAEAIAVWLARSFKQVGWNPEERGRARTIREIMLRVPAADLRRAPLSELASITEAVRYAAFPADAALYAHSKGLAQQVMQTGSGLPS